MEIYHRDHWIIIVHMTTWNDLTIWNEENTIIDWINHLGRIVKHVFSKPSRLRCEGRGPFYGPVVLMDNFAEMDQKNEWSIYWYGVHNWSIF